MTAIPHTLLDSISPQTTDELFPSTLMTPYPTTPPPVYSFPAFTPLGFSCIITCLRLPSGVLPSLVNIMAIADFTIQLYLMLVIITPLQTLSNLGS